jgi:hypothetical protein
VLVCPACRSENAEGALVCQVCGRSLAPGDAPLRRPDSEERLADELDVPAPAAPRRWPAIVALAAVIVAGAGAWIWYSGKPNPCQGRYSSALFPYCAVIPEGWTGRSQLEGAGNIDRFETSSDDAITVIRADPILDPNSATEQYAQQFRTNQAERGLVPSPAESVLIDGEEAIGWDVTGTSDAGEDIRLRDVVLVRGTLAWHIRLLAEVSSYEEARLDFEDLLASWRWDDA